MIKPKIFPWPWNITPLDPAHGTNSTEDKDQEDPWIYDPQYEIVRVARAALERIQTITIEALEED